MRNFNFMNQTIRCVSGANRYLFRYVALVVVLLTLGVGETWASITRKVQLQTVTQSNTGYGLVYASESNSSEPAISGYYTNTSSAFSAVEATSKDYYLWAIPTQRGVEFVNWTATSSMSGSSAGGGSYTLSSTDATKRMGAKITVTAPTSPTSVSSNTTVTTTANATANWKKYKKVTVTYGMKNTGSYRVSYKYPEYDSSNKTFTENGGSFFDLASGTKTEDAYHNEEITLSTSAGNFLGWYSDADCTVSLPNDPQSRTYTSKTYTYVVPDEETTKTVYALFDDAITLYGRLNVQWATTSAADGGLMYVSTSEGTAGATFTATPQTVDLTSYASGTTTADQIYYLYAQNADPMKYVFVGWYDNPEAEGEPLGTEMEYAYTLHGVTSTDAGNPDKGTVYACFGRISSHYLQVDALPGTPGLGMVLTSDKAYASQPDYEWYKNVSSTTVIVNSLDNTTEGTVYLYAQPKYGYEFKGWYDNAAFEGTAVGTTTGIAVRYSVAAASTDPLLPTKKVLYAKFEQTSVIDMIYEPATNGSYTAAALDIVDVDGEYVWGYTQLYSSEGKTANTTVKQFKLTGSTLQLNASPNTGKKVKSYKDGTKTVTTISYVYNTTASPGKTMGVTFDTSHPFKVGSALHDDLQSAIDAAASGSNKTIIVVDSAYVPKPTDRDAYEIPSGVTLLVPYDNDYTLKTTKPNAVKGHGTLTPFMKLVLAEGTVIVNKGAICVGAEMASEGASMDPCGGVRGPHGRIIMNKNSRIDVESGANLYCWGFITGPGVSSHEKTSGIIQVKNGAKVYECLQITDFQGGGGTVETTGQGANYFSLINLSGTNLQDYSDKKVFTVSNYYLQNVEVPLSIHYGGEEYVVTCMTVDDEPHQTDPVAIIKKGSFFSMDASGAIVTKRYDGLVDRVRWEVDGTTSINAISITIPTGITMINTITASSAKFVLNLVNNMDIVMRSGTCTVNQEMAVVPGASIEIQHGATMDLQKNIFVYDSLEWKKQYMYGSKIRSLAPKYTAGMVCAQRTYVDSKGYANFNDAYVKLNGLCKVSKSGLYTTANGANIYGTGGGIVQLDALSSSSTKAYQVTLFARSAKDASMTFDQIPLTSPQLRNWNNTFTSTASATAGAKFYNVRGAWVGLTQSECFYLDWQSHKYVYTDDFIEVVAAPEVYPNAWQSTDCENLIYIHTADNCTWVPTHTVEETTSVLKGMDDKYWQYSTSKGYWEEAPSHKVTFMNFNGKILEEGTIYHTGTPTYNGYTPVRPTDDNGTYTFTGWDQPFGPVTSDVEYKAQYTCTPHEASVTAYALTTYYPTIEEAFAAAKEKSDATIKLLRTADIGATRLIYDVAKTCTLDLNGHTISGSQEIRLLVIDNENAVFTVTDLTEEKNGTLSLTASTTNTTDPSFCALVDKGKLYLEAGTIYIYSESTSTNAVSLRSNTNGEFIMNGGTAHVRMTQSGRFGYGTQSIGKATINGGTIRAESENGAAYGIYVHNANNATMTVNGGKFYVTGANASSSYAINTTSPAGKLLIKGGYYNTSNNLANYVAPGKADWNYYRFNTTAAEKAEVGNEYAYKVAEAYTVSWTTDGDALTGTYTTGITEVGAHLTPPNTPTKIGYTFDAWSPEFTGTMPSANTTYEATWAPNTNTPYTVKHFKQALDGSYAAAPDETDNLTGTTATNVTPDRKSYEGFTSPAGETVSILADGSRAVEYKYTRNSYTLTWNLGGGKVTTAGTAAAVEETSPSGEVKYEAAIVAPEVEREGYRFTGWNENIAETMPTNPLAYAATWVRFMGDVEVGGEDNVEKKETVEEDSEAVTTIVHSDAVLEVEESSTLNTTTFIIEAISEVTDTEDAMSTARSGSGEAKGNIEADYIYFDLILNNPSNRRWNAFTVPFIVDLRKSGHPIQINGEPLTLGRGYDIIYYNGATRAEKGPVAACWEYVEDPAPNGGDSILYPGKAYMIASASRAIQTVRFTKASDPSLDYDGKVSVAENATEITTGNNGGWNGIGNPMMCHAVVNAGVMLCQVHDGGEIGKDGYHTYDMDGRKLVVGKAVFVQVGSDNDNVPVAPANGQEAIKPQAPRRTREQIIEDRYDVRIAANGGVSADRVLVLAEEDKEDKYVILKDLSKAGVSPVRAQMWVDRYGEKLCMNTTALINNKANYPLTISAPKAGEYDIFLNGEVKEGTTLYLTYDGKAIWNLTYGSYTAILEKGLDTHYGLRVVINRMPTGIEETTIQNGDPIRKVIVDDKVYIIRNGEIYSVTGQKTK